MMAAMPSSVKKSIFSSYFLFLVIAFGMGGFGIPRDSRGSRCSRDSSGPRGSRGSRDSRGPRVS
jgi:hypothetical protein